MGRSPCCEKEHTNKGAWTKEEDQRLVDYIHVHGEGCWRSLPKAAGLLRCGKSCRLRWINYLRPDLKRGNFTPEEDDLIIKLHSMLGNKWSSIAGRLPGRTDNEIKNYWNTHIKRKLISRGIDPVTHRLLNSSAAAATAPQPPPIAEIPLVTDKAHLQTTLLLNVKLESAIATSSSSGTTTDEDQKLHEVQQRSDHDIDLELSIGLAPSRVQKAPHSPYESKGTAVAEPVYDRSQGMCLWCELGHRNNSSGKCRNCQGSVGIDGSGLFGHYRHN
ncbi:hypothetical protein MLD38_033700 [Melastoma candidum]|uniref:Uncharacterized protein n=1 Tax=Melastoma candidum TaxID=119954 RepID=A0ACB9M9W8_9MYRT|nr:hypothetical protein MLD38_033700 [Melastoma candidum]